MVKTGWWSDGVKSSGAKDGTKETVMEPVD